jgi:hypothetical protein
MIHFFLKKIKLVLICFIYIISCGFVDPIDILYKNINLIPDTTSKDNNYPRIPQYIIDAKSERILPKLPKIPDQEDTKMNTFSVKKILKSMITDATPNGIIQDMKSSSDKETPLDGIKHALNIPNMRDTNIDLHYLENEASELPIINTLPSFPYLYNNETPVVKNIEDIKIKGLDDVLSVKISAPVEPQYYDINFPVDHMTPDDALNTDIIDIIP